MRQFETFSKACHKNQSLFRLAVVVLKDQSNENGKVHEWFKCPDCKSGIRWFESNLCLMTDFLLLLIITAFWCFGVKTLFSEGFLLERVGDWAWEKSEFLSKPLFQCPPCMASIHGISSYLIFVPFHSATPIYHDLFTMLCFCLL